MQINDDASTMFQNGKYQKDPSDQDRKPAFYINIMHQPQYIVLHEYEYIMYFLSQVIHIKWFCQFPGT